MTRRQYKGAAAAKVLLSTIAGGATSCSLTADPGAAWPDGSTGPFIIAIDRGLSSEEKVLCDSRTGASITFNASGRGYDGTTGQSHSAGAAVEHVLGAIDIDEPNAHINTTAQDDHTQYLNTTRHDVTARHAFGAALGTPAAAAAIGTTASAGVSGVAARSDHVHTGPLGRVAYASTGTLQSVTNSGLDVDLTTLTTSFTFISGRAYRITGYVGVSVPNSTSCTLKLKQGTSEVAQDNFANQVASGGSFTNTMAVSYVNAALSGSITFKLSAQVNGAAATNTTAYDTSYIMVEDIGT